MFGMVTGVLSSTKVGGGLFGNVNEILPKKISTKTKVNCYGKNRTGFECAAIKSKINKKSKNEKDLEFLRKAGVITPNIEIPTVSIASKNTPNKINSKTNTVGNKPQSNVKTVMKFLGTLASTLAVITTIFS